MVGFEQPRSKGKPTSDDRHGVGERNEKEHGVAALKGYTHAAEKFVLGGERDQVKSEAEDRERKLMDWGEIDTIMREKDEIEMLE